jgi:hypothetical protein
VRYLIKIGDDGIVDGINSIDLQALALRLIVCAAPVVIVGVDVLLGVVELRGACVLPMMIGSISGLVMIISEK